MPPGMYEEFFSFAFVRNPYSWLVSEFEVVRQNPDHRHYKYLKKMKDFSEYVEWEVRRGKRYQYPLVTDENGQVMVNFLGHFERLREAGFQVSQDDWAASLDPEFADHQVIRRSDVLFIGTRT